MAERKLQPLFHSWLNIKYCSNPSIGDNEVEKYSETIVDQVLEDVNKFIRKDVIYLSTTETFVRSIVETLVDDVWDILLCQENVAEEECWTIDDEYSVNIIWPKIDEFDISVGLLSVKRYVQTWEMSPDWKFCVEFLGIEREEFSNYYIYEVEWSKPTPQFPVPQAVVNVYFSLEVSNIHHGEKPIQVTYLFETSNVIHIPDKTDFQERRLETILNFKLKTFRSITF